MKNQIIAQIVAQRWRDKMPKYINADEMIADENEAYLSAQCKITDKVTRDINFIVHTKLQRLLADAPAADVIERNTLQHAQCVGSVKNALDVPERNIGKWEIIDEVEPRRYGCSNCKRMVWHIENFCPNCGAKMEG